MRTSDTIPTIDAANEWLAQADALIYHKEYEHAVIAAYEAAAAAARVPLYERLVDPFTADEALWEFENLFVLSGQTQGAWEDVSSKLATLKEDGLKTLSGGLQTPGEVRAQAILNEARSFVSYCAEGMFAEAGAAA